MKFKEIKAIFKVVEDTAFKNGEWSKDRSDFKFEVERNLSGCFAYGDRSGHSIKITDSKGTYFMPYTYDTRYDGISTQKDEWVKVWKDFIEDKFVLKIELDTYEENDYEID